MNTTKCIRPSKTFFTPKNMSKCGTYLKVLPDNGPCYDICLDSSPTTALLHFFANSQIWSITQIYSVGFLQ